MAGGKQTLNMDKTNFLMFHPRNKPMKNSITSQEGYTGKNYIKYLGVMIDSTLSWHIHVKNISKKISRAIGLLYKIRHFVDFKIMKTLYYSLIYPYLLYAIEIWGSAGITTLNRLLFLQKRIVRLLSYSHVRRTDFSFPPSNPLFFKEQLLKVHDIFKMTITKFIYNCLNKTSPVNFQSWFKLTVQVHNHNTRSQYINIDKLITTN